MARVHDCGYAVRIEAHGGEAELYLIHSWGQDGRSPLTAVAAHVDGGPVTVIFSGETERYTRRELRVLVRNIVREWQRDWVRRDMPVLSRVFDLMYPYGDG